MIDRYARPAMKMVWSEENKNNKWLQVELAVCEAWTEEGVIPSEDMIKLRNAQYDPVRLQEVFQRTRHDMTAFLQSVTGGLGDEGRWIHMGLTSHDVQDTAQGLQLIEASDILLEGVDCLLEAIQKKAVEHKYTPMMGRTHGVHAEPTTFGLKLSIWWDEMRRNRHRLEEARKNAGVGKISGAVGTYATVPPQIEERVCSRPWPGHRDRIQPDSAAGPPRPVRDHTGPDSGVA